MTLKTLENRGYLDRLLSIFDPINRKYGNPHVQFFNTTSGIFSKDDEDKLFDYSNFFKDTPYIWNGNKILDIGCRDSRTLEYLTKLYPNIEYVGLDIKYRKGVDVIANARKELPFENDSFDTVMALRALPINWWGIIKALITDGHPSKFEGNIKHWEIPLKKDGYFVALFFQNNFSQKQGVYKTVRKTFKIIEERTYKIEFDNDFYLDQHYIIAKKK